MDALEASLHSIESSDEEQSINLLVALSRAAIRLQKTIYSEESLLNEFCNQIVELSLYGLITLLDDQRQDLHVYTTVLPTGNLIETQSTNDPPIHSIFPLSMHVALEKLIRSGTTTYLKNGQAIFSAFVAEDAKSILNQLPKDFGKYPAICSPLSSNNQNIGILIVLGEFLAESDSLAIDLFSKHFATALENARSFSSINQSKSLYHTLIESMTEAVFLETMQGQMIDCNSAACKLFGYTKDEILKLSVSHLVTDDIRLSPTETPVEFQHPSSVLLSKRADGSTFPVEVSLHPVMIGSEQLLATHIRDITARKEVEDILLGMESVLRRQTEELSAIFDVSRNITASQDLPALLETIVEQGVQLLNGTGGGFYLCDSTNQIVKCVVSYQTKHDFKDFVLNYGEGLAGKVAQTGQPMIIDDYRNWSGRASVYEDDEPFRSVISAPVIWQGKVTGVLHILDNTGQRLFTQSELRTLTLLANQAAVAIANSRLLEGERRRRQEAETLRNASTALISTLDLQDVLDNILIRLSEVIPYDSATVFLIEGDRLHGKAARGLTSPESVLGKYFSADDRLFEEIRQSGEPLILDDAGQHPDFKHGGGTGQIRGWMGIPLISKEHVIGYLTCDSRHRGAYQPADAALAQAFANQAATVIENARLFEAERSQLLLSQTLQKVGALLTTQLSLNEVLETILNLLGRVVHYDSASIQLLDPSGKLSLAAGRGFEDIEKTRKIVADLSDHMLERQLSNLRSMVIPDTENDDRWQNVPNADYIRSWAGAPLLVKGRLIGCLNVDSRTVHAYDDRTGETVMAFAHQAAIAIENARLFERVMTEQRHLRLLYDLSQVTTSSLDPDEILQRAITLTTQALGGLVGQAYVTTPEEDNLKLGALYGRSMDLLPVINGDFILPIGVGLTGWVAKNRVSASAPDVTKDIRWKYFPGMDDGVMSALCAPILAGDRLLGVLSIFHHQLKAFSDEHLRLLDAICQEVGLALSNAEKYQQIQKLSNILHAQQRQLENLVEHMPVGVLLLDHEFRILVKNPLGHKMLKALNNEELPDSHPLSHVGPFTLDDLINHKNDLLPIEFTKDEFPKQIFAIQMRSADGVDGNPQGRWVLTINDVTQERESLARIQIQDRLATVGQLAAGIAHDFNNIMATILVYTDLMQMDTSIQPASKEKLETIKHQIQRASSLIRQILDFSRKSVMDQSNMDLLPLVKELDKILARTLPETIQVELSYEPDNYWIKGDPTRLQQVFMNLALNARDAMPNGGKLKISLKHIHLPQSMTIPLPDIPAGNWVLITVADTGTGIPPELQEHIFEPFFTTKPVDQGTGLGLAQVYGIVKQHDGFIDFNSHIGKGTSFMIYLPALSIEVEQDTQRETGPLVDGSGFNVLIVEDDRFTREALRDLLTAYGFKVKLASNGIEALHLMEKDDSLELVISDIVMPKMGGLELYETLEKRYPEIKVLLITGHPIEEKSHNLLELGNIRWLQKPFSAHDFRQVLVEMLDIDQR